MTFTKLNRTVESVVYIFAVNLAIFSLLSQVNRKLLKEDVWLVNKILTFQCHLVCQNCIYLIRNVDLFNNYWNFFLPIHVIFHSFLWKKKSKTDLSSLSMLTCLNRYKVVLFLKFFFYLFSFICSWSCNSNSFFF